MPWLQGAENMKRQPKTTGIKGKKKIKHRLLLPFSHLSQVSISVWLQRSVFVKADRKKLCKSTWLATWSGSMEKMEEIRVSRSWFLQVEVNSWHQELSFGLCAWCAGKFQKTLQTRSMRVPRISILLTVFNRCDFEVKPQKFQ